jgi:uncharacterized protein YecT (DUF1311 family)
LRLLAIACALALLATPAVAQKRPELDGPSQLDMNQQAITRLRMADQELNAVYNELMAAATPGGRERLRATQRAWIAFRDLECESRVGARGGSFRKALIPMCLEAVTDERTRALQSQVDCQEGSGACSGPRED